MTVTVIRRRSEWSRAMQSQLCGPLNIRIRSLPPPCLWCWEIEDGNARRVESSWENRWEAFDSWEEALNAGLIRLSDLARPDGAEAAVLAAVVSGLSALVIVGRDEVWLHESLRRAFHGRDGVEVIRDRRSAERRRREEQPVLERRRRDRRAHPDLDAQVRTLGWAVFLYGAFPATAARPDLARRAGPAGLSGASRQP